MEDQDLAWRQELERRIRIYEQMEANGPWPGRLQAIDYLAMLGLSAALVIGFWSWGY